MKELALSNCPICRGIGFLLRDVPPGHEDFGRLYPCGCRRALLQQRHEAQLRDASSLVGKLLEKRFDTFRVESPAGRQALDAARAFARSPAGWLVLVGAPGRGKTHLAAAIANARLDALQPVLFVVVPDLLDHLRATYNPASPVAYDQRFHQVRDHPLLVLDDLGSESPTAWADEKLYQILNHRYNAALPTVITSNLRLEEWDPRIRMRAQDSGISTVIRVDRVQRSRRTSAAAHTDDRQNWL